MTQDEIRALQGLVESLVWLAFLSGMAGAVVYSLLARLFSWLIAEPVSRRYGQYLAAASLARTAALAASAKRRSEAPRG
ncbi:hypothetical protein [Cupriavidus alkaliphilus]|uniref:hypothetical protein n=1 Tax=Cupriavidus alkaliphilus TaxID=942866 RepID=UPI0016215571|nr:hypothetical protein [Cupriavidus alkaliphilus]MBB3013522.1 hypothetical protein [Cupriavidus alkaliphilus]